MKLLSQKSNLILIISLILLLAINYNIVNFGIESDFFGILFSVILFFIGGRETNFKVNYLLVPLILIFEFISFRLHTKSLHFLSLLLFICLIYYYFTKKFSFIAFICILLFSSLFNKFFEHLTTEIKQSLCNTVYLTLRNFITIDKIEGVNFYINGSKIAIDNACMGLSMFKTGLLVGAVLLTLEEKKQQKYFGIFQIICFCVIVILLNIVSNYFRIISLILLNCTRENILHHSVGLMCFVVYQVVPMLLLIRFFKPKYDAISKVENDPKITVILIIYSITFITSLEMKNDRNDALLDNLNPKYDIVSGQWVDNEVFKIQTTDTLIYIKTPSHKPLICWTGDGYKIIKSKEITLNNEKVWYNVMEKNKVNYVSYWWYECGTKKYTSFVEVMFMKLIYNKPVRLINETSVLK